VSILSELSTLYSLAVSPITGKTHAQRLESFYKGQAGHYDAFRKRLLHGRQDMFNGLELPEDAVWADFGGGTGSSLEFMGGQLDRVKKGYIVDLSPSLLEMADERIRAQGYSQIETVEADVTTFEPAEGALDVATFSYSLTMIPDWFSAVEQAWRLLRPGGVLGVVDFFVSRKYPADSFTRHGWLTRSLWPLWFASDNVNLSPDHVPYLHTKCAPDHYSEHRAPVPFLIGLRVPYYVFIGRKPN
jgi:S-adenosylmethionine-diacylgycerolhomoserine-N-methlytransferase